MELEQDRAFVGHVTTGKILDAMKRHNFTQACADNSKNNLKNQLLPHLRLLFKN
jgi:hypothetical protein